MSVGISIEDSDFDKQPPLEVPKKISDMGDRELQSWHDAGLVIHILDDGQVAAAFQVLDKLNGNQIFAFNDMVDDEIESRAQRMIAAEVAHVIEQADAKIADGKPFDWRQQLQHRTARLLRLLSVNAPDVILEHSLEMVIKSEAAMKAAIAQGAK